jgi:uncharacterized protein YciI
MALFHVMALDKPGALDIRMANRPAHLDWASSQPDHIRLAGPVFADDGETFAGSVFLIEAEDEAALHTFLSSDPYQKAGLFGSVDIRPFKWVIGVPDAG